VCNSLNHRKRALQHTATHYSTLQHTTTHCIAHTHTLPAVDAHRWRPKMQHTATHCNTLQHTATHTLALPADHAHRQHPEVRDTTPLTWHYTRIKTHTPHSTHTMHTHPPHTHVTGWRRYIGCLKVQVSFRKRTMYNRAFVQKITYEDKASYGSLPPCTCKRHTSSASDTCKTAHYTATKCTTPNHKQCTLLHTAAHCNIGNAHCSTLQHTATHTHTLPAVDAHHQRPGVQHTATYCNTLQHTHTHITCSRRTSSASGSS